MSVLNIRGIGEERKAALETEAKARGMSISALVRQLLDESLSAARRERERQEWVKEAMPAIEYQRERLAKNGPSLARYRLGSS